MVEVLISGAGPAGVAAAVTLARRGVRVLLVDRARRSHESAGGVAVSPRAMIELAALDLAAPIDTHGWPLSGMRLTGPGRCGVSAGFPTGAIGRSVSRRFLDALLLEAASAAGAQVREGVDVAEPLLDAGAVRGAVLLVDGRRVRIPAAVTIGADGRQATLARALGLVRPSRGASSAVAATFAGVAGLGEQIERHVRPGHWIGLTPLPDGSADVFLVRAPGRLAASDEESLEALLRADARLAQRFAHAQRIGPPRLYRPMAVDVPVVGAEGLLLAGDAAGTAGPFGGDGVRVALRGGVLAAEVALGLLDHRVAGAHEELARRRHVAFGTAWDVARRGRALAASPTAFRAACALARVVPRVARAIVAVAGDACGVDGGPAPAALPATLRSDEDRAAHPRPVRRAPNAP